MKRYKFSDKRERGVKVIATKIVQQARNTFFMKMENCSLKVVRNGNLVILGDCHKSGRSSMFTRGKEKTL